MVKIKVLDIKLCFLIEINRLGIQDMVPKVNGVCLEDVLLNNGISKYNGMDMAGLIGTWLNLQMKNTVWNVAMPNLNLWFKINGGSFKNHYFQVLTSKMKL